MLRLKVTLTRCLKQQMVMTLGSFHEVPDKHSITECAPHRGLKSDKISKQTWRKA